MIYFLRSQMGGGNSFLPLNTTRKEVAITNIEEFKANQFRQRHDIPDKKKQKPSPLIGLILDKYREASYPDSRQKERDKDSSYYHGGTFPVFSCISTGIG
jgi:hypothetical protein